MRATDREISTRLVVILLVPVVTVAALLGYVVGDSLTVSQPPTGPDAAVVLEDHPDRVNRSGSGEGIVQGTLEGSEALNWSAVVVELIDPRAEAVVATFQARGWTARGAGQTIALRTNGTTPLASGPFRPGDSFVLRDVADAPGDSRDLVNACSSSQFRVRHRPTDAVLGTYRTTFVPPDWMPDAPCAEPSP